MSQTTGLLVGMVATFGFAAWMTDADQGRWWFAFLALAGVLALLGF